jgi:hypothetical protein
MGGAYNRVCADATAFVHRGESYLVQHLVVIGADATMAFSLTGSCSVG